MKSFFPSLWMELRSVRTHLRSLRYGKDIIKPFGEACHKHGMKAGFYYSARDWYHPDYLVRDNAKYDAFYRGQVEELLSNYRNEKP